MPKDQQDPPNSELTPNLPLLESQEDWPEPCEAFGHQTELLLGLQRLSRSLREQQFSHPDEEYRRLLQQIEIGNLGS